MSVTIREKQKPDPLSRRQLRNLVAYHVTQVPKEDEHCRRTIIGIEQGDVVVSFDGDHCGLFNATQQKYVRPHQANIDWHDYKFRRARYVESISLTFDPDED